MRNEVYPLLDLQEALPHDREMCFSDIFFFRVMIRGLLDRRRIADTPRLRAWLDELQKVLDLDRWLADLPNTKSSPYHLSLLWLHAAALAWYHREIGALRLAHRLEVARDQLEVDYWRKYGATLPSGWKAMLASYRAPLRHQFVESLPAVSGFSLYSTSHELLVRSLYLSRAVDLRQPEVADTVRYMRSWLRPGLERDIRLEVLMVLHALDDMSREECLTLASVGELQRLLHTSVTALPARTQREHFHAQLLAQLLLMMWQNADESPDHGLPAVPAEPTAGRKNDPDAPVV